MGLERPKPTPRTSLDSALREVLLRAIQEPLLFRGERVPGLADSEVWVTYTSAQLLPQQLDRGLEEVERRYRVTGLVEALISALRDHVESTEVMGLAPFGSAVNEQMARAASTIGARTALDLLPDQEFLTALQDAAASMRQRGPLGKARRNHVLGQTDRVFRTYGLPYEVHDGQISWSGDDVVRQQVLEPALVALQDDRISGARDEFVLAQRALRGGTPDKLRDATHEAANAVEAVLLALIDAHDLTRPKSRTAAPLFNALREGSVLPASLESTVMAAPQLRNAQGGHTQGPVAADADQRVAESAVASAAVAISALAQYLP